MAERAKKVLGAAIVELAEALPDVMASPLELLTPAQALGRASLVGLQQLNRIIEQELDFDNVKQQRLVGDMALGANKLLALHAEGERNSDLIGQLLKAIKEERGE